MSTIRNISFALFLVAGLISATSAHADDNAPISSPIEQGLRGAVVDSPCPGPACTAELQPAHAQHLRVVYLNFDGVTLTRSFSNDDARQNVSAIVQSSTTNIPAFNPNDLVSTQGLTRSQIIQRVMDDLYTLHAPYNVEFTTTRPTSGYYSMVVFGGSCQSVAGSSGCAGIALRDCGDQMPSNITFVFPPGQRIADLATTAAQEAAHAFGLGHTDDSSDVMYPAIQSQIPTHFGAGNIMGANGTNDGSGCPSSATYQDSNQKMLDNIGPRGQDTTPPTVQITSPADGADIPPGAHVTASATDNLAVDHVTLELDGTELRRLDAPPWEFALSAVTPEGAHTLTVRAWDINDNMNFDRINVTVTRGSGVDCTTNGDCPSGEICQDQVCVTDPGPAPGDPYSPCTGNADCKSGVCATVGDQSLCSATCTSSTDCPTGGECLSGTACWPTEPTGNMPPGGKSIWNCQAGSSGAPLASLALFLGLIAVVRRRKR